MPKRASEGREKGDRQGPLLLPQLNKILLVLLLIFITHLLQSRPGLLPDAFFALRAPSPASGTAHGRVPPPAASGPTSGTAASGPASRAAASGPASRAAASGPASGTAASGPASRAAASGPAPRAAASGSAPRAAASPQLDAESSLWAEVSGSAKIGKEPDWNHPVLLDAAAGDRFPVVQASAGWLQIQVAGGQKGWLPAGQATKKEVDAEHIQIVRSKADAKLYWGPDETFGEARRPAAAATFIPEQVSGQWIRLSAKADGQPLWMKTAQAVWTSGPPPAKEAWANEVRILSAPSGNRPLPLAGRTIVIDPGHGGKDSGAIAKIRPVYERDVNLAVAQVLEQKLKAAGARVIMTRTSDDSFVALERRVEISNANQADAFVSIHQNMFDKDPSVHGTITFYESESSKKLAGDIAAAVSDQWDSRDKKDRVEKEQLYVLTHNLRPAVLVEGCFLSNPKELSESVLTDYREKLAKGIYMGLLSYFKAS